MSEKAKTVVVTGGGAGIGRGICLGLAADGLDVAVLDIDSTRAEEVALEVAASGRRSAAIAVDVADGESVREAMGRVRSELGPIGVLVNNAGFSKLVPFLDLTEELWDRTLAVHLRGTFLTCHTVLPEMSAAGWGRIINMASVAGLNGGGPTIGHYAAAKGGIISLSKALALEFAGRGITVNVVAPGLVDTPGLRDSGMPGELIEAVAKQSPVQRIGTPEDIAAACSYLASDRASYCTGQVISPNGGVCL